MPKNLVENPNLEEKVMVLKKYRIGGSHKTLMSFEKRMPKEWILPGKQIYLFIDQNNCKVKLICLVIISN